MKRKILYNKQEAADSGAEEMHLMNEGRWKGIGMPMLTELPNAARIGNWKSAFLANDTLFLDKIVARVMIPNLFA